MNAGTTALNYKAHVSTQVCDVYVLHTLMWVLDTVYTRVVCMYVYMHAEMINTAVCYN